MAKEIKVDIKQYPEIGEVEFTCRKDIRNMRMRVKNGEAIKVSYPKHIAFSEVEAFLLSKKQWIIKSKQKLAKHVKAPIHFSADTEFSTRYHKVEIKLGDSGKLNIKVGNNIIHIFYPVNIDWQSQRIQAFIKKSIIEVIRYEAKHYLPQRTHELATKHALNVGKVSVREAKTRWGSCSGINDISLNIHLIRLPDELIDHVILHELAHIIHKNHSKTFHDYLEKLDPNSKRNSNELKKYRTTF